MRPDAQAATLILGGLADLQGDISDRVCFWNPLISTVSGVATGAQEGNRVDPSFIGGGGGHFVSVLVPSR